MLLILLGAALVFDSFLLSFSLSDDDEDERDDKPGECADDELCDEARCELDVDDGLDDEVVSAIFLSLMGSASLPEVFLATVGASIDTVEEVVDKRDEADDEFNLPGLGRKSPRLDLVGLLVKRVVAISSPTSGRQSNTLSLESLFSGALVNFWLLPFGNSLPKGLSSSLLESSRSLSTLAG